MALVPHSIACTTAQYNVAFRPLAGAASTLGLYLNWRDDNPSPLPASFLALLDARPM